MQPVLVILHVVGTAIPITARLWRQPRGHDCGFFVCGNVWPVEEESAKNGHHRHRQKCHRYNDKIDLPPVRIFASVLVACSLLCLATRNLVYLTMATRTKFSYASGSTKNHRLLSTAFRIQLASRFSADRQQRTNTAFGHMLVSSIFAVLLRGLS